EFSRRKPGIPGLAKAATIIVKKMPPKLIAGVVVLGFGAHTYLGALKEQRLLFTEQQTQRRLLFKEQETQRRLLLKEQRLLLKEQRLIYESLPFWRRWFEVAPTDNSKEDKDDTSV
ncbi:MAG: hypothetical protein MHM6MM_006717, partial [Cercozoa sp. M6MM]